MELEASRTDDASRLNLKVEARRWLLPVRWLSAIFGGYESATRDFLRIYQGSALRLFLRLHAPLLVIFPLAGARCPAVHLGLGRFSIALQIVVPLVLVIGALVFAALFDQVVRYADHPSMPSPAASSDGELRARNIALFLHLPLSATGIFFCLHPLLGYLMLLIALVYSLWIAIEATAIFYELSRARVLVHMINTVLLGLVPLAALVLAGNVLRNILFIKDIL